MTDEQIGSLAIRLEDQTEIIWARPRPEDERLLAQLVGGGPIEVSLHSRDDDTEGHGPSTDVTLDVEGNAMTIRLPTAADAAALRKALAVGAVTATIVAAGAIAAMQGATAPATQTLTIPQAGPAPALTRAQPSEDFQLRKEAQTDSILEAPAAVPPAAQPRAEPREDFRLRKDAEVEKGL